MEAQRLDAQAGQRELGRRSEREASLIEGIATEIPAVLHFLHDLLQGHFLAPVRLQQCPTDSLREFPEGDSAGQVDGQRQDIDETPHHVPKIGPPSVGERNAHDNVRLPGVPVKEDQVCG